MQRFNAKNKAYEHKLVVNFTFALLAGRIFAKSYVRKIFHRCSGVEGGIRGWSLPSCYLKGAQPPTLQISLEIRAYRNHYSVVKGYFGLKAVETPSFYKI